MVEEWVTQQSGMPRAPSSRSLSEVSAPTSTATGFAHSSIHRQPTETHVASDFQHTQVGTDFSQTNVATTEFSTTNVAHSDFALTNVATTDFSTTNVAPSDFNSVVNPSELGPSVSQVNAPSHVPKLKLGVLPLPVDQAKSGSSAGGQQTTPTLPQTQPTPVFMERLEALERFEQLSQGLHRVEQLNTLYDVGGQPVDSNSLWDKVLEVENYSREANSSADSRIFQLQFEVTALKDDNSKLTRKLEDTCLQLESCNNSLARLEQEAAAAADTHKKSTDSLYEQLTALTSKVDSLSSSVQQCTVVTDSHNNQHRIVDLVTQNERALKQSQADCNTIRSGLEHIKNDVSLLSPRIEDVSNTCAVLSTKFEALGASTNDTVERLTEFKRQTDASLNRVREETSVRNAGIDRTLSVLQN